MASHVHLARFLCADFTVSLAGSVSALPADMAAHLERTLVSGAGVMFPDETLAAVLNVGTAVVDDAWPAAFLARAVQSVRPCPWHDFSINDWLAVDADDHVCFVESCGKRAQP